MAEHEIVMPFVTVTSKGGPHDDDSYVAGFEMGRLDTILGIGAEIMIRHRATIQAANREQADLIAMRHGCTARFADTDVPGWITAVFTPTSEETDRA